MTMSTHNGEKRETGADEQGHGHPKKPRRFRRWALLVVVLSVAALAWSCVPQGTFSKTPVSKLAIGDAVIAVRLSGGQSRSGLSAPLHDNWIMLLDEQARQKTSLIGERTGGDILWTKNGISYGGPEENYLTTDAGTSVIKGKFWGRYEIQRYGLPDGRTVVVTLSGAGGHRLESIELDGSVEYAETTSTKGDIGLCGSRILLITETEESPRIKSAASAMYTAQSGGDSDQPEALAAVAQLDEINDYEPRVLAVAPKIDGLYSGQTMFACDGDVITMPTIQAADPESAKKTNLPDLKGTMVLQRWDLATGQRTIIPVRDEQGNPIELNRDRNIFRYKGVQVGREYRFISEDGHAFSVDLDSGQGRYLFKYAGPGTGQRTVYQVSETGVYALEDRWADHHVTLAYRPWDGGERREVFSTDKMAGYIEPRSGLIEAGYLREIESFALRPGWDGGAQ